MTHPKVLSDEQRMNLWSEACKPERPTRDMVCAYARAIESATLEAVAKQEPPPMHNDGWLQDGGLLYRLTDGRRPENRDEINVTMADGSRSPEARARRAGELLDRIRATNPPAQQEPFGYFKAEPFGWTDCAETDEGAVALYERPQKSA